MGSNTHVHNNGTVGEGFCLGKSCKRKTYDNPDFHISRVQQFVPASGKVKLNKVTRLLDEFITEAFDKEGEYKDKDYQMITTDKCMWCPFYKTIKCSATFEE